MDRGKNNIKGHAYSFLSRDIDEREKYLALYAGKRIDDDDRRSLELVAAEAFAHGWSIITNGLYNGILDAVTDEALKRDGRINAVSYDDVMDMKRVTERQRPIFVLRGGIYSPLGLGKRFSLSSVRKGDELLSLIADAAIFVNHVPKRVITDMLDEGVEVALLRTALREHSARLCAYEGCPVIDSFSSWKSDPLCWAWRGIEGDVKLLYP